MTSLLVAALLAAAASPISLAAPNLSRLNLDETAGTFYNQHLAQQLAARGLQVTTSKQIEQLIGLERQKQLMGCTEDSASCLAELANALGVDGIITGEIGRFDRKYQFNIKVMSARDGRELSSYAARVDGEEPLLDELVKAAKKMAPEIAERLGKPLAPPSEAARRADLELAEKNRRAAWIPFAASALLAGGSGLALLQANANALALRPASTLSTLEAQRLRDQGSLYQTLGFSGLGVAAVSLGIGAGILLLNPDPPAPSAPRVSVLVGPSSVSITGAFN